MDGQAFLFSVLRYRFGEGALPPVPSFEEFEAAYRLASCHKLEHIVYYEAKRHRLLPEPATARQTELLAKADRRVLGVQFLYAKMDVELERCCELLTAEKIAFVPMKGALLCAQYPEPWMRTRCDIDLLVHEADIDRAVAALTAIGYTTDGVRQYHNLSLICQNVHLELHYSAMERHEQMDALLSSIWEHTVPDGYRHIETPSFFRFHHVAHMAHHFLGGGCGIRSLVDLWLLRHTADHDEAAVSAFCEQAGLLTFYQQMCRLCDIWFGGAPHDEQTRQLERFIVRGGAYGTEQQREMAISAVYGKWTMAKRLFLIPYRDLKNWYPSLDGKRWLTPVYRIGHLMRRLLQGRGLLALSRIRRAGAADSTAVTDAKDVFSAVGLIK